MAKKKGNRKVSRTRRVNAPSRSAAGGRRAGPPSSGVANDLLAFADNLRANACEAMKFVDEEVQKRVQPDSTKKAETRFVSRANKAGQEMRSRAADLDGLNTRCTRTDPCRALIDGLVSGGLRESITIVSDDLLEIAARAQRPVSDSDREELRGQLQAVRTLLETLVDIAAWIEDEATILRGETVPGRAGRSEARPEPPLPPEIDAVVREWESVARRFITGLGNAPPALEPSGDKSILAWVKWLPSEINRLRRINQRLVGIADQVTDRHRQEAERGGHVRLLQFLDMNARLRERVALRQAFSTSAVTGVIERAVVRLSLTDEAADAASEIIVMLERLKRELQSDQYSLNLQAQDAKNERAANAVTAQQLPSWSEINGQGDESGGRQSNLAMLLRAFIDHDEDEPSFEAVTKRELAARLEHMFGRERNWGSWIDRWLPKLMEQKIVFPLDRPAGSSRRNPDWFQLCRAAIRKYRAHLVDARASAGTL